MKSFMLGAIRWYRRVFAGKQPSCRFIPTCSEYALEAIEKYGAAKGFWLSSRRILRCNPFRKGGYDPVP
jgi:hypothetical protein